MCYVIGNDFTYGDHTDHDAGDGNYSPMGSIMVLPGCTAYLFKEHNYEGERSGRDNYITTLLDKMF